MAVILGPVDIAGVGSGHLAAIAAPACQRHVDRHLMRPCDYRATLLGSVPRVGRESEVRYALSDCMALAVVGLDDFPVIATAETRVWLPDPTTVIGDGALGDAERPADLGLRMTSVQ